MWPICSKLALSCSFSALSIFHQKMPCWFCPDGVGGEEPPKGHSSNYTLLKCQATLHYPKCNGIQWVSAPLHPHLSHYFAPRVKRKWSRSPFLRSITYHLWVLYFTSQWGLGTNQSSLPQSQIKEQLGGLCCFYEDEWFASVLSAAFVIVSESRFTIPCSMLSVHWLHCYPGPLGFSH